MQPDVELHRQALKTLHSHAGHEAYGLLMFIAHNHFHPDTRHLAKQMALELQARLFGSINLQEPLTAEEEKALDQLSSENPGEQNEAMKTLNREHDPENLQKLLLRLQKETDPAVIIRLIEVCSSLGGDQVFSQIAPFLRSGSEQIRQTVIRSFVHFGRPEIHYLLIRFSRDGSAVVQKEALDALKSHAEEPLLQALNKMSQPGSMALDKEASIYVIAKLGLHTAKDCLERLIQDKDSLTVKHARQAMAFLNRLSQEEPRPAPSKPEEPSPAIEEDDLKEEAQASAEIDEEDARSADLRQDLIGKILQAEEKEAVNAIFGLMENGFGNVLGEIYDEIWERSNKKILATFVMALGNTRDSRHADFLIQCLEHPDSRVQANAIESLRLIGMQPHKEKILPFLDSRTDRVKANAITALHAFRLVDTEREVTAMLRSRKENRQLAALYIVTEIFDPAFIHLLEIALDDPNPKVSRRAMEVLGMYVHEGHAAAEKLASQWGVLEELKLALEREAQQEEEALESDEEMSDMDSSLSELNELDSQRKEDKKQTKADPKAGSDEGGIGRFTSRLKNLFRKEKP